MPLILSSFEPLAFALLTGLSLIVDDDSKLCGWTVPLTALVKHLAILRHCYLKLGHVIYTVDRTWLA